MAALHPFRALRPRPAEAAQVAAVPYDVVSRGEARALAGDNPLSFLRVSRAEIELAPETDPYSDVVYERASENFLRLKERTLVVEDEPSVYFYRLRMGSHDQTGLVACYSIDEYERGGIRKHERTRRDKEDDRTRHMSALGAQTGPVFLTYQASPAVAAIAGLATAAEPLFDFAASDGVQHTVWRVGGTDRDALAAHFEQIPRLYIADGHHRAASAARTRTRLAALRGAGTSLGDGADFNTMLAVAFPHDQVQILAYNRVVTDLGRLAPGGIPRSDPRAVHDRAWSGGTGWARGSSHVLPARLAHPTAGHGARRVRSARVAGRQCPAGRPPRTDPAHHRRPH